MRVDPETKLCLEHGVLGCTDCMLADFRTAIAELYITRLRAKAEAKATPVNDRFDIGGEG